MNYSVVDMPFYVVYKLSNSENMWLEQARFKFYTECIEHATDLYDAGEQVKLFDPHMGKFYRFPEDF